MDLFIEIIGGEPLGARFKLGNGFKIGRKGCDISVRDPKISSHHADLVVRGEKIYLVDNHSSNGIKSGGKRVPELLMSLGVEFRLGNTSFRVVDVSAPPLPAKPVAIKAAQVSEKAPEKQPEKNPESAAERAPENAGERRSTPRTQAQEPIPVKIVLPDAPLPPPEVELMPTWQQVLMKLIQNAGLRAENIVNEQIAAFNPPLKFRCIQGVQFGKTWLLGYGPRKIGPKSLDLVLNESMAPPICFEVLPTASGGVEFKTTRPDVVKVNGRTVDQTFLYEGDVLEVFNTQLVVEFDHERN